MATLNFIYKRMKKRLLKAIFQSPFFFKFFLHISIAKFLVCLACCFNSLV